MLKCNYRFDLCVATPKYFHLKLNSLINPLRGCIRQFINRFVAFNFE
jgi:hypothetical protein